MPQKPHKAHLSEHWFPPGLGRRGQSGRGNEALNRSPPPRSADLTETPGDSFPACQPGREAVRPLTSANSGSPAQSDDARARAAARGVLECAIRRRFASGLVNIRMETAGRGLDGCLLVPKCQSGADSPSHEGTGLPLNSDDLHKDPRKLCDPLIPGDFIGFISVERDNLPGLPCLTAGNHQVAHSGP